MLTRVSLGKSALPESFTGCAREFSYGWNHHGCYLYGGSSPGDDPDLCPQCPGNKAARAQWRRYIEAGGTLDLRSWAKDNVRLPDALGWAEMRAECKMNPCL